MMTDAMAEYYYTLGALDLRDIWFGGSESLHRFESVMVTMGLRKLLPAPRDLPDVFDCECPHCKAEGPWVQAEEHAGSRQTMTSPGEPAFVDVYGFNCTECGTVLATLTSEEFSLLEEWMQGYLYEEQDYDPDYEYFRRLDQYIW